MGAAGQECYPWELRQQGDLVPSATQPYWRGLISIHEIKYPTLFVHCIKSLLPKYCPISNILQLANTYGLGKAFLSTVSVTLSAALGQRSLQHHLADKGQVKMGT